MGALVQTFSNMFPPQFREKTFWWAHEENTWASPIFFTPPSNQTPTKNIFLPFFSPFFILYFFSILPIPPPTKRTLSTRRGNCASSLSEGEEGECSSSQIFR